MGTSKNNYNNNKQEQEQHKTSRRTQEAFVLNFKTHPGRSQSGVSLEDFV
jgi:hypothetical protein